jgi:predicted branched-subunit amino acid permease
MTAEVHRSPPEPTDAWTAFVRATPTAVAIFPVGMLFGVLAARAHWSSLEILLFSALGFSGSGQFALLPLVDQGLGFLTMLLMAVSINSRYIPIAFATASRLPHAPGKRAFLAHLLGDEAYALERERDPKAFIFVIRLTIYGAYVLSTVAGGLVVSLVPHSVLGEGVNLGFPASVVLLVLSFGQIKTRVPQIRAPWHRRLVEIGLCVAVALLLFTWLGRVWFWLPSIGFSTWRLWRAGT